MRSNYCSPLQEPRTHILKRPAISHWRRRMWMQLQTISCCSLLTGPWWFHPSTNSVSFQSISIIKDSQLVSCWRLAVIVCQLQPNDVGCVCMEPADNNFTVDGSREVVISCRKQVERLVCGFHVFTVIRMKICSSSSSKKVMNKMWLRELCIPPHNLFGHNPGNLLRLLDDDCNGKASKLAVLTWAEWIQCVDLLLQRIAAASKKNQPFSSSLISRWSNRPCTAEPIMTSFSLPI